MPSLDVSVTIIDEFRADRPLAWKIAADRVAAGSNWGVESCSAAVSLIANRWSDVDLAPFSHVADAFMLADIRKTAQFNE